MKEKHFYFHSPILFKKKSLHYFQLLFFTFLMFPSILLIKSDRITINFYIPRSNHFSNNFLSPLPQIPLVRNQYYLPIINKDTDESSSKPTPKPTSTPISTIATTPTSTPTIVPTSKHTSVPTSKRTSGPTSTRSPIPTSTRTSGPTSTPTPVPTSTRTSVPTSTRTSGPTSTLTPIPTFTRTYTPTSTRTSAPTSTTSPGKTIYYVSTSGNDSNPGTYEQPWRTISKAARTLKPGDTVYIREGIYSESVHFETSGTSSSPINILAYPDENPVIDGNNTIPGPGSALLWFVGNYIYSAGIEVRNSTYFGILVLGNYDVIDSMYVHHNRENGILIMSGHNSTVENCLVWRNAISNEYANQGYWSGGLTAARSGVSYVTLRHNTVWENWGEGISAFEANQIIIEDNISHDNYSANIYVSDLTNVLIQRNFVYRNPSSYIYGYGDHVGIMLGDENYDPPSANITIINNIAYGNHGNFWWWQGVQGGGMNNVLIANNTFVNGIGDPNSGQGGVTIGSGNHQNVRFENNLVQQDGDLPVIATISQSGITYSHNLWSKTPYSAASGPGDTIGNPLLAHTGDPYTPDWFKLTSISPAIDKGMSLVEVVVDYFGYTRVMPLDMGAIEYIYTP
jgi:hypothetical protein